MTTSLTRILSALVWLPGSGSALCLKLEPDSDLHRDQCGSKTLPINVSFWKFILFLGSGTVGQQYRQGGASAATINPFI
jgi:hypothetical protein